MTSLRFVGDLPVWLGLLLAVVGAVMAFAYYRRESFDLPGRLRWLLPCLRALAIWMVIVSLTGPVLHHRQEIGQLGSVRLLVDTSQSMTASDPQMPLPRKLMIAREQGWLPQGQFDTALYDLSNRIATVRRDTVAALGNDAITKERATSIRSLFSDKTANLATSIAATSYPSEGSDADHAALQKSFDVDVLEKVKSLEKEAIENTEQAAKVRDQLIAAANRLQGFEEAYSDAFADYCEDWIQSQGDAALAGLQLFDQSMRIRRIESQLLDRENGLVARLKDHHHVDLAALVGQGEVPIWSSRGDVEVPTSWDDLRSAMETDLASGLILETAEATGDDSATASIGAATVLFSDGQHNTGPSPSQLAGVARSQHNAVYTVGFGTGNEPTDLVMLNAEYPDTVYKTDRVRGTLIIKDRMPEGRPFVVQIRDGETVVWQEELKSLNVAQRRIDFDLAVEPLVESATERFDAKIEHHSMPLELTAQIVPADGETEVNNNAQTIRFAAVTQRQKVLLIDSRSRWETRYLKNLFERDSGWEIRSVILENENGEHRLPKGDLDGTFPTSKQALFEFDLIIYGDVSSEVFNATETTWLRDFVDQRGGGMIFIDGAHKALSQLDPQTLGVLLPVTWSSAEPPQKTDRLQLTDLGSQTPAFAMQGTGSENEQFWQKFSPPHRIASVEAAPGAEVLAEAVVGKEVFPAIVSRSFGGGRVLYFAFDETWRWRYRVADHIHQRFWNQVARWVMPRPFAVSDQYLALDSGPPRYQAGQSAPVRAQLRGPDGNLVSDATVDTLLWREGRIVATVSLQPEENLPGTYAAETAALDPGEYEVTIRASGFNESAFEAKTQFVVAAPQNKELDQVACNEALLLDMATAGGGQYLREEQLGQIVELLQPLSSGRVVQSETLLWQSWPWFLTIVGLLSVEWLLRKRSGLL
ncbi:hypothetical protein EC9_24870 [Rosistilla ulvae]|uniref:VWFA domain-containing protein n=1 Tax=Rosistilla ulvae TaxID=1930277 RepID=A0A517M095_9BACT|nr:hypothetical protein [Rosistilla ulvae]QDS88297.1 hypothetical protein EC9_24870 [Rosistilla ulvae]